MGMRRTLGGIFPAPLLAALLVVSFATNVILLVRLNQPTLWNRWRNAFLPSPVADSTDHMRGTWDAPVTIIEYADYQCPYCAEFHAAMRTLVAQRPESVRWIYRHFPIEQIHPYAARAAEAAECAGEQGRFWEYSDALFERQAAIDEPLFAALADSLQLDGAAFAACLRDGRFGLRVARQAEQARDLKISGTPTFFVNGDRFSGSLGVADLEALLQR